MEIFKIDRQIKTSGKGLYEISNIVSDGLHSSGFSDGMVNIFVQHTSCSLVLMENADPSARNSGLDKTSNEFLSELFFFA